MKKKNKFEQYNAEELAESLVFPVETDERKETEFQNFLRLRNASRSDIQKTFAGLMQLKFEMEDYIQQNEFDKSKTFGSYLRRYIEILGKKNKDFAAEIDLKNTELSQVVNNHRSPNFNLFVRLELHSNNFISAVTWFRLFEKEKENFIANDEGIRNREMQHVKNHLALVVA